VSPRSVLVVGAGLMGAATAWQLAVRGHEVTLVDRDVPAGAGGSSHGSARIFRYAYPDPLYAELVVESEELWSRLRLDAGQELIRRVGCLDHGRTRDPEALAAVLDEVGVDHELLSPRQASRRWPGITFTTPVLHQPDAGVIDAETAVHAMTCLAVAAGARLLAHWPVASITRTGAGFTATGPDGARLEAGHVVIAAGGWLPGLLQDLSLPPAFLAALPRFTVQQEYAFHFPYREPPADGDAADGGAIGSPVEWPAVIHKDGASHYALPGGRDAGWTGQKLATYNGGTALPDASAQTGRMDPSARERAIAYVRQHLPGLVPEPYAETTCLFTNTPTEDFVVDTAEGVTVVSACSGHGAKFAPLIGAMAADLATGDDGPVPVPDVFRPGRLTRPLVA
jgi:sarcosine oxidase